MKKIQLAMLTASIIGMSATAVNAQSKFEGFYGQVGVGYETVAPSLSYGNVNHYAERHSNCSLPIASSISNSNSFAGTVTAGYTFVVTKDFLLGIGAEYSPLAGSKANYSASNATIPLMVNGIRRIL
jgi:outer membrane immunogenic protein